MGDTTPRALIVEQALLARLDRVAHDGPRVATFESLWLPGDELTETLKLRRGRIVHKHSDTIDNLYHG